MADQVTQETGTGAGALGGNSLIRDISTDLGQLSGYFASSTSTVRSLSDLGVTFNDSGQMSVDPSVVAGFSSTQMADAFKFFGSSNSGFAAFANNFTSLSDPISGSILSEEDGIDASNTNLASQISTLQSRAALTHHENVARLEAADALVAQLQSDQNTVNAEVQSINYVNYGRTLSTTGA
jgi:flagellar capping protein FliD